jgi:hypothetical protein
MAVAHHLLLQYQEAEFWIPLQFFPLAQCEVVPEVEQSPLVETGL